MRRLLAPGPVSLDVGALVLRLWLGAFMLTHGVGKAAKLLAGDFGSFPDPLGVGKTLSLALAVGGEAVAPVLLVLGLATRLAALPYLVTMLVAGFVVHAGDPFGKRELALSYAVGAVLVLLLGPGRFSLDATLGRRAP